MSTPSQSSTQGPTRPQTHQPSSFTVKKGRFITPAQPPRTQKPIPAGHCKWYDCLRPVPGYQGFGGLGVDSSTRDDTTQEELEAHAKLQDYTTKVPSLGFHSKAKPKKGDQ